MDTLYTEDTVGIVPPVEALLSRLTDSEFRDGYAWGYRVAVADFLARCEFLLTRTVAIGELHAAAKSLLAEVEQKTSTSPMHYEEAMQL